VAGDRSACLICRTGRIVSVAQRVEVACRQEKEVTVLCGPKKSLPANSTMGREFHFHYQERVVTESASRVNSSARAST
jgi:hypothetical protein